MGKLTVLLDTSKDVLNKFVNCFGSNAVGEDTICDNGSVSVEDEFEYIKSCVDDFSNEYSNTGDFLFIRFSGRKEVSELVGDELSQMVITASSKRDTSFCHADCLTKDTMLLLAYG